MKRTVTALAAAAALLTGALSGCGAGAGAQTGGAAPRPSAGAGDVNAADVMFLQMMIPHHRQSIEIARLAGARSKTAEIRTLAEAVAVTQAAEVYTMTERLHGWGQPLSVGKDAHAAHGGMPQTAKEEIDELRRAPQAEFDERFLQLSIGHHDDAVRMANVAVDTGSDPAAVEFARQISRASSAQADHMLDLLTAVPGGAGRR